MSWWRNARGEWYVVAQAVLMLLVALAPWSDRGAWTGPGSMAAIVTGIALAVAGTVFAGAGLAALGRNLTPFPRPRRDAALVETGIYAVVRHPIYSGLIMAAFGWGLAWRSPATLALAAALLVFFDVKSRREERWLAEKFDGYADYRRRVRKLIPFVY